MKTFPSLKGQGMLSIDLETFDPDLAERGPGAHRNGYIAGIAIAAEKGFRGYYPIAHEAGANLPKERVIRWLNVQLADAQQAKVGAHLAYDLGFLKAAGVRVNGPLYDIQIAEPLLDENRYSYSLNNLAKDYLGETKNEDEMVDFIVQHCSVKKRDAKAHIWRAPAEIVAPYAISDVELPLKIFAKQAVLLKQQNLWDLFLMEAKLIPMLVEMHHRGVRVDLNKAEQLNKQLSKEQKIVDSKIHDMTGMNLRPWVARDIAKAFTALGLEYPLTTKTSEPSFKASWLEHHLHPLAGLIRRSRWLDKMRTAFLEGAVLNGHTHGRVHCQFNQLKSDNGGAVSGRFSSSKPNLQQIPIRTNEGKLLRTMFLPDEGQSWFKFDFSQIEYRLITQDAAQLELPGAQTVVDEFNNNPNADFHQMVANMTGLPRERAKTVNFGLAYGEGVKKLCFDLGLSREEGERIINEYHQRAPFMRHLSKGMAGIANVRGVIETLMGRKRRFVWWVIPDWKDPSKSQFFRFRKPGSQRAYVHKALNARIQGSAADIMKKAMVEVWESGVCNVLGVPQLTIHDELDGSFSNTKASKEALKEIKRIMETVVKLCVPLKVNAETGASWGSCE